jgi:hypothetical protein
VVYTPRMLVPGKAGATLPFTPALSAPADDASFLRGVLEAIPGFVLHLDHEPRTRYVDRVYDGLALDQFIGRPVREFVASERRIIRADGQVRWGLTRPCPGHRLTYAYGTAMLSVETN